MAHVESDTGPWTWTHRERILFDVDEPEPGWQPGDHILVDLSDGQTVRCRIVNVKDDGTIQVVPEHAVIVEVVAITDCAEHEHAWLTTG